MSLTHLIIRDETLADIDAISEVTRLAFDTMELSSHTEQFIVLALRKAGVLTVSLVAELEGEVVGHIAFSPITISDGSTGWYGVGPLSVIPQYQRMGVGAALMRAGLERMKQMNAHGCCLVGHPEYYGRFGFVNPQNLSHEGVPAEAFFALAFDGLYPLGEVVFHPAFFVTE